MQSVFCIRNEDWRLPGFDEGVTRNITVVIVDKTVSSLELNSRTYQQS